MPKTLSPTSPHAVQKEVFGELPNGQQVHLYTLTNANGIEARVMEYGAILVSVKSPDASAKLADLTHGFDTLDEWVDHNCHYFGATIGRFGNRIAHGKFSLDGNDYQLATNNAPDGIPCALHGGTVGFDKVLWTSRIINEQSVEFSRTSKHGEEGYPGTLEIKITYSLNDENELMWQATATTDAPTVINMVHHSYWNISGDPSRTIHDHRLMLNAAHYLPTDSSLIPTGEIAPVAGTPMDFTQATRIGDRIDDDFEALHYGAGYDHCWVLAPGGADPADEVRLAARLEDPKSGRCMELFTNQPGIQFYTANFLDESVVGKGGVAYARRSALCLETEGFPDAPNKPDFPSCVLRPNETYKHVLVHKFSTL